VWWVGHQSSLEQFPLELGLQADCLSYPAQPKTRPSSLGDLLTALSWSQNFLVLAMVRERNQQSQQ
jgi:hypothetical protein